MGPLEVRVYIYIQELENIQLIMIRMLANIMIMNHEGWNEEIKYFPEFSLKLILTYRYITVR